MNNDESLGSFVEREDDLPPPDKYHAARDLAEAIGAAELSAHQGEIGLPDIDPARWESLDIARAAAWAQAHRPDALARAAEAHPWLRDSAASVSPDAAGALVDGFLHEEA